MKVTRKGYYTILGPDGELLLREEGNVRQVTSRDECYERIFEDGRFGTFIIQCPDREVEIEASGETEESDVTVIITDDPGGSADESDFQARYSGSTVAWYHGFDSESEVDQFRWSTGIGSDPEDGTGGYLQNTINYIANDGVNGAGCLEAFHPAGIASNKDWRRPFKALSSPGNGRATDDPAASGAVALGTWSPTQGDATYLADFSSDRYGPPRQSGGVQEGREFFIQFALKVDQRRLDSGINSGKIIYINRTEASAPPQELVLEYRNSTDISVYKAVGPRVLNDLSYTPFVAGEWAHYLWYISPGDEYDTDPPQILEGGNTHSTIWRQRPGESGYTKVWQTLTGNSSSIIGTDYADGFPPKGWDALQMTCYLGDTNVPDDFYQRYDQIIFSRNDAIPPRDIASSELWQACNSTSAGQLTTFSADPGNPFSEADLEWQTNFHYDPIRNICHLLSKPAGGTGGWGHAIYDIAANTWTQVDMSGASLNLGDPSISGHVYGNSDIDQITGRVYLVAGNLNTATWAGVPTRRVRWYDPDTGVWNVAANDFFSGALNDTSNGVAWHPHAYGRNIGAVVIDQQFRTCFWRPDTDAGENIQGAGNESGTKYGIGLYWPEEELALVGGSDGGGAKPLRKITTNPAAHNQNQLIPQESLINVPPIRTEGNSRGNDTNIQDGFGALLIHPRDPKKVLLIEQSGTEAYIGTWNGTSITWGSNIGNPFGAAAADMPRVYCSIPSMGCVWAVGNNGSTTFSKIWRPPV